MWFSFLQQSLFTFRFTVIRKYRNQLIINADKQGAIKAESRI